MSIDKRTLQELRAHLLEQLDFLQASSAAFDLGNEAEARRLALTIRVLIHDTPASLSLLSQLGAKDYIRFVDSMFDEHNFVHIRLNSSANAVTWAAPLGEARSAFPPALPFDQWWHAVLLKDADGREFTRRDFVLAVAHKDGGAHIDVNLPEDYEALTRFGSAGVKVEPNPFGMVVSFGDPTRTPDHGVENRIELTCIRQIAFEVEATILDEIMTLLSLDVTEPGSDSNRKWSPDSEQESHGPDGS